LAWLGLFGAASSVLLVARWLRPDPRGFGTHTQLGLPPCGFFALTGVPCPACGLTTSFAHLMHGELALALHANPLGVVFFALTLASLPVAMWAGVRALPLAPLMQRWHARRFAAGLAIVALFNWLIRITALLHG
jgi:hypothetical protein